MHEESLDRFEFASSYFDLPQGCARLYLRCLDPADVEIGDWEGCKSEGVLFVPRAGEMLYRLR